MFHDLRNVRAVVADALQIGHQFHHGTHLTKVEATGCWRSSSVMQRCSISRSLVVDGVILGSNVAGKGFITVPEGLLALGREDETRSRIFDHVIQLRKLGKIFCTCLHDVQSS